MTDGAVVVVGGTRGIGLELVRHYADAGRQVVLHGRDGVEDFVQKAGRAGARAAYQQCHRSLHPHRCREDAVRQARNVHEFGWRLC